MTLFAEKVHKRMKELNMNQKTLSSLTGIAESSLSRYLDSTEPRIDIINNVSKALGVLPSYFFDDKSMESDPYQETIQVLGRNKNALTPEQKAEILKIILK